MIVLENILNAFHQLWANRFHSVLTTLGIVIAVMAIICVVSILEGMSAHVSEFIVGLGADVIWIIPRSPGAQSPQKAEYAFLTLDDADAIRRHSRTIRDVSPVLHIPAAVGLGGQSVFTNVIGTNIAYQSIRNWYVDAGRFFSRVDMLHANNVCVLGRDVVAGLETDESIVGKLLRINQHLFKVVGILEKKGSFLGQKQDDVVLIPISTAQKIHGQGNTSNITILAQARSSEVAEDAREEIRHILRRRYGLRGDERDNFEVITQEQALDFFRRTSRIVTVVLAGIVGVSLLVGGVGIMNIMLVSVTERTREIGILKAIGASRRDILMQFLTEAVILSLVGGLIGIVLGVLTGYFISHVTVLPPATVPLWAVVLSFFFSALVGISFGLYPAMKAARLNPIEALRYE